MHDDMIANEGHDAKNGGDRAHKALGERLKTIRKRRLLTITQLALYTGFSVGYLSNVERGQTSPTVDNLQKICDELGVSITEVLAPEIEEVEHIKLEDAQIHDRPDYGMQVISYAFGGPIEPYCVIIVQPGEYKIDDSMHPYSETCYVISGELHVRVDERDYHLKPGDSVNVHGNYRHIMRNEGDAPCTSIWFHTAAGKHGTMG